MKTILLGSCLPLCFLLLPLLCCFFASSFLMIDALVGSLAACRPDQIHALKQLKNEFDSRSCNQNDYFNGVKCSSATGAVTKLKLPHGCLTGILKPNSSLFGLHHLRYLDLSHNNLASSSLPSQFGNLNRLEVLSLSSNGFIGHIPSSVSNLIFLTHLNLSHNKFTGSFPLVRNLTKLSTLYISYNHISGTIPSSLLTMSFLSYIDLTKNQLTGPIEVPNSSSTSRLEHLFLGHNHFEGQILAPISKFTTLKHLDLSFLNKSYPIDLKIFSSLKSLLSLDLSGNSLLATSISLDSDMPSNLIELVFLGCDITEFPIILKTLQNLERVDISNNRMKGKVPEWFWKLPRLRIVTFFNNSLDGFDGSMEVLVNSSVHVLELGLNIFKGSFPNPPLSINILSAPNNSFTGDIPLSICGRSFLDVLDLSYNNFSGKIPPCLSNFTIVNLRKNNLEGSLPDEFYSNALTQTFDVGYNRLVGKLPRSLLNCSSLRFLCVDHNRIKDTFPFWLKALPNLQALILCSNKFDGSISPLDQGPLGFPELQVLEISDNNFNGNLSSSYFQNWKASSMKRGEDGIIYMGGYKRAYYIYQDSTDLQYKGSLAEQAKVLASCATINFSGNRLGGQIPESIGLLKALIALNLSNNAFIGQIPTSLANFTELESLDLSRNQLSGNIPEGIKSLSFLAYISVAHNQLKGEIPQGPHIIGQSKSSFEGNVGLCGLPLEDSCFNTSILVVQQLKQDEKEVEEEVLNWKAVVIGYGSGVLLGLAIGQFSALYKT